MQIKSLTLQKKTIILLNIHGVKIKKAFNSITKVNNATERAVDHMTTKGIVEDQTLVDKMLISYRNHQRTAKMMGMTIVTSMLIMASIPIGRLIVIMKNQSQF